MLWSPSRKGRENRRTFEHKGMQRPLRDVRRRGIRVIILGVSLTLAAGAAPASGGSSSSEPVDHRLLASQKRAPAGAPGTHARLAMNRDAYRDTWKHFRLRGERPRVNWQRKKILFVTTGESGICPLHFGTLRLNDETKTLKLRARSRRDECTGDWTPRTFVIAVKRDAIPKGRLSARVQGDRRIKVRRIR
ncbi:hypothetical protein BH20ACT23_BH20ACT23_04740 [soil metagenome]